jgi:hypothetical protein
MHAFPDPSLLKILSPLNANVWKVLVEPGDVIQPDQVVAILEVSVQHPVLYFSFGNISNLS